MAKKAAKQAERSKKSEESTQTKIGDKKYDVKPKEKKSEADIKKSTEEKKNPKLKKTVCR